MRCRPLPQRHLASLASLAFIAVLAPGFATGAPKPAVKPSVKPASGPSNTFSAAIAPCCKGPLVGPLAKGMYEGGPAAQPDGKPWPAGHANDVYFTGKEPVAGTVSSAYRLGPPVALKLQLGGLYPGLSQVAFRAFFEPDGRTLTPSGEADLSGFLQDLLGKGTTLRKLGSGGQQIAFSACPSKPGAACVVAKVRKLARLADPDKQRRAVKLAAMALRQDLAIFSIAHAVTVRGRWLGKDGKPAPLVVRGKVVTPPQRPAGPPGRLARVARVARPSALQQGVVVEEFIRFAPNKTVDNMLAGLKGPTGALRDRAWEDAPRYKVNRVLLMGFFDAFPTVHKIGPDVIRLTAFMRQCADVRAVPVAGNLCDAVQRAYNVPDDFLDRVRGLEQLYRDTAADVIRFKRANFKQATGNPGADGKAREIGLDYNHGRNVGWDPLTGQFVLFDV